uniref:Uncharacterized protein n=1 Tax=Leviviridae sp. TaxID=2027243 RepID=A0A514D5L1_9VIRU|nr:MAG: hypothetical protein H2RhizoLitter494206_000003 [Leviviridae sp.]
MRSSPSFLVESRSGGDGEQNSDEPGPKGPDKSLSIHRPERPEPGDGAEVSVRLKVGYKTVLLVVVVFDFVHLSFREIVNTSWFEHLLLGIGT